MLAVNLLPRKGYYQKDEDDNKPLPFWQGPVVVQGHKRRNR